MIPPDLQQALQRLKDGTHTPADLETLRRALSTGQIAIATGERAVAAGAGIQDSVIVTGDGNVVAVLEGANAATLRHITPDQMRMHEQRYLELVRWQCGTLYTEGVDQVSAPLSDVFVMLEAVETLPRRMRADISPLTRERAEEIGLDRRNASGMEREAQEKQFWPEAEPSPRVPLSKALQEHRHLVILGDPGSGKTTTLQFIALCFATEGWGREKLGLDEARVPIRVELREYSGSEPLGELLVRAVAALGQFELLSAQLSQDIARSLLGSWMAEGRLIVLLDGLDEVPETRRSTVAEAITRFARTDEGHRCRIVVTARTAGYRATRELGEPFGCYKIQPFTGPDDALPYAAGWLKAIAKLEEEEAQIRAQALLEKMEQQRGLRRVMGNPLLLRLVVALYHERGELVQSRTELYRRYVDEVLEKREQIRGTEDTRWNNRQIESALDAIAWTLQTEGQKTIAELAKAVERQVEGIDNGKALVGYLRERLGLLTTYDHEGQEVVAFRHLTFREYFVARRLEQAWLADQEGAWDFLRPRLHHPDWREPVLLLAATLDETEATELVRCILDAKSPYEQELHRDLLLAGECLSSGVRVGAELRHVLLDRLLRLYLRGIENPWTDPERTAFQQLVVQPIETILGSLGEEDRAEILPSLLAIARGEDRSVRITPGWIAAYLARETREFFYSTLAFLYDLVRRPGLRGIRPIIFPPYLKFISPAYLAYLKELQAEAITYWRSVALKGLGNLKFRGLETTSLLLEALDNVSLRGVAAEVLGKVGPGTPEVVMALVNAQRQHRHAYGWDKTVEKIVEALGVLGQRHPEVVELLLDIVSSPEPELHLPDVHYPVTWALCKAAETSPRAMAFVLEGWRRLDASQIMPDGAIVKVLDEGVREGLKDGRKEMIRSASPEVIQYLLDAIRDHDDPRIPDTAGEFLARVVGDTPLVQCKVVEKDGTIRYRTLDLTEEVFDVFLRRPYQTSVFGNVALSLLVRWGLNRSELIIRLINTVREADAWLLAGIIESGWIEQGEILGLKLPEETIVFLKQSVARLRSSDKATREAELNSWRVAARSASEDNWYLKYLPEMIESTKCETLSKVYGSVYAGLWAAHEHGWGKPLPQVNPYVMGALACFRGWYREGSHYLRLTAEEVQEEFLAEVNQALSILQNPGRQAIEVLASILAGEGAKFASRDLEKKLERKQERLKELMGEQQGQLERWRERSKPDFRERSAAAYALAQLAGDYPEAQAVLLSNLKPPFWRRGSGFHPETEFQEHLIRALGYVRNANCDLVSTLLDIAARHDEDVYRAGSDALSRLQNPSPKAVSLLLKRYKELNEWGRACLIKALGTFLGMVEPPISKAVEEVVEKVVDRLLSALKDKDQHVRSAAAKGLGNLREPEPKVIDALLACLSHNLAAVEAIGRLTDRIPLTDSPGAQARLARIARALWRARQRSLLLDDYDPIVDRSGYDVFCEALNRVVARLTELEVAALPADLPLPGKSEVPVVTRLHPISPGLIAIGAIVSTILGSEARR